MSDKTPDRGRRDEYSLLAFASFVWRSLDVLADRWGPQAALSLLTKARLSQARPSRLILEHLVNMARSSKSIDRSAADKDTAK